MQFWSVDEIANHAHADHEVGEEISPGVVVNRRTILRFGLSAAGLAMLGGLAGCVSPRSGASRQDAQSSTPSQRGAASVDDFMAHVMPQARALIAAPAPDEEAYLAAVSTLLARVEAPPKWRPSPKRNGRSSDSIAYYPPVVFLQIQMAPNAVIHLHDHRHYNGILLATKGSARCRNFDIVQENGKQLDIAAGEVPAKGEDFLIRQSTDVVLRPRQFSTLTRDRDNIHHVEAGDQGATLLDFFTHFSPKARSYGLEWGGKPYDKANRLYRVAWKNA